MPAFTAARGSQAVELQEREHPRQHSARRRDVRAAGGGAAPRSLLATDGAAVRLTEDRPRTFWKTSWE